MIRLEFEQTVSGLTNQRYEVRENGSLLYSAWVPFEVTGHEGIVHRLGEEVYRLRHDGNSGIVSVHSTGRKRPDYKHLSSFSVLDADGNAWGRLYRCRSKPYFGFLFYEFVLDGMLYTIYEVGCGKDGIKLPVYNGDKQVGLIEKGAVTYDNKDTYSIAAINKRVAEAGVLFTLYYDFVRFGRRGEVSRRSKKTRYYYTTNKALKEKYNPDWKSTNSGKSNEGTER